MIRSKRKETFIRALRLYTLLVTLITVALMILGYMLDRDRVFGYEAFLSPLLYALIGTAATLVTRPGKELSVRSLIIRKVISLLLIEGAIILLALNSDTIPTDQSRVLPGLMLGILAVFLLTHIILYLADRKEAERLSADLARYQEKQINESAV